SCPLLPSPPARPSLPTRRSSDLAPHRLLLARREVPERVLRLRRVEVVGAVHEHARNAPERLQGERERIERVDVARVVARAHHDRSEEHTSELQSRENLVCRLLLE